MARDPFDDTGRRRPARRSLDEFGNRAEIVFVTVCTHARKPLLAFDDVHELLTDIAWPAADHWMVGRYVIMPDHLHLFCAPAVAEPLGIKRWVAFWKSKASNAWPRPHEHPVWQQDCWDRQLRSGESYSEKWDYVRKNPVRHGLVDSADAWPFRGELSVLEWHDE